MRYPLSAAVAISLLAGPAHAQETSAAAEALKGNWQQITAYITRAAEEASDSLYAFRPTPDVRSFGQLIGHVAGAQYMICGAALGDPPREEDAIERTTTAKAELVAALKASTEYCAKAYAQGDKALARKTKLFGQEQSRLQAITLNTTHNAEHYGNLVTYLRINGIVPPSSRRGS